MRLRQPWPATMGLDGEGLRHPMVEYVFIRWPW